MSGRAASLSWSIERPRSQDLAKSDGERRSVAGVGGARRDDAATRSGAAETDETDAVGDEGGEGAETREGYGGGGGGQGAEGAGVDVSGQNRATLEPLTVKEEGLGAGVDGEGEWRGERGAEITGDGLEPRPRGGTGVAGSTGDDDIEEGVRRAGGG